MDEISDAVGHAQRCAREGQGSAKSISDFLLGEGTGIRTMSMAEVAIRSFTSKPTLVRYAQAAGYSGWQDYRKAFLLEMEALEAERASRAKIDVNHPYGKDSDETEVLHNLMRIQTLAQEEVKRGVRPETLARAADLVLGSDTCLVFAAMHNLHLAEIFASDMRMMGKRVLVPTASEAAAMVRFMKPGDCVVVVSYAGIISNMLPMSLVPKVLERGQRVVAITNSVHGTLREVADVTLGFAPQEHYHDKICGFYSKACTSLILDALYSACYVRQFDTSAAWRQGLVAGLADSIPQDFEQSRES